MKKSKKMQLRRETIDGFDISVESEGGHTFAVGYCPICGKKEDSIGQSLDPAKITASKLKVHMQMEHKEKISPTPEKPSESC